MNAKTTTERKTVAPSAGVRASYVGTDEWGYDHVWMKDEGRVVRLDETGIERSTDLDGHGITEYRRTVETQVGWETRDTMLAVALADTLAGMGR